MTGAPTYRFGPQIENGRTLFRLWAPGVPRAELLIEGRDALPMEKGEDGFHRVATEAGPGTPYRFRIGAALVPDLASRQQATDVDGWSVVRAPLQPSGRGPIRPWHEAVIAEVHVGTASPKARSAG